MLGIVVLNVNEASGASDLEWQVYNLYNFVGELSNKIESLEARIDQYHPETLGIAAFQRIQVDESIV